MDTLKPPQELCLTGNVSDNWKRFEQRVERKLENLPKLQRSEQKLKGYGTYDVQIIGKFVTHVEHNGKHRMTLQEY